MPLITTNTNGPDLYAVGLLVDVAAIMGGIIALATLAWWLIAPRLRAYVESIATDVKKTRQQLEPNGGPERPNPSTHDLMVGVYQRLNEHCRDPEAHERARRPPSGEQ